MKLTALEKEIMRIIWKSEQPVTVRMVMSNGYPNGEKAYTTIQTVMNNLMDKQVLQRKKVGNVNVYSPVLHKKKFIRDEMDKVMNNFFNGSALNMISFLIGSEKLKNNEIEDLENILNQYRKENDDD